MHYLQFWQLFQEGLRLRLEPVQSRKHILQRAAKTQHRKLSIRRLKFLIYWNVTEQRVHLNAQHLTRALSGGEDGDWVTPSWTAEWVTPEQICIKNLMSNEQEGRMEPDTIKSRTTRMSDSNSCVSAAQPARINVSRAHGGPVNASPNMMKQPLRRKRASLSQ